MSPGTLAILGSGETAPGMTKVHRVLLSRLAEVRAVNLDSAYGFQENVPQMSEKLEEYFRISLQTELKSLHFTTIDKTSELERSLFKQQVREGTYVFAGPGSPSYALKQWAPLDLGRDFLSVLDQGGTLCIASAAALTLGAFTVPVYEIYKVGDAPYWLQGLNVLGAFGLECAVIPHFDNNEGANYDTSCCYIGLRRLELMEHMLPANVATFGVDEHTAAIFDLTADTLQVEGRARAYWRHGGNVTIFENGSVTPLETIRSSPHTPRASLPTEQPRSEDAVELGHLVAQGGEAAPTALAQLISLALSGAKQFVDPTPLIEGILEARESARSTGDYALSDTLRDVLVTSGVTIFDTPSGTTWSLT
jgi:hypothetical protein